MPPCVARVLFLFAFLISPAHSHAGQQKMDCRVQEELFAMLTESQAFLTYLETGQPAGAPEKLRSRLIQIAPERFRAKLAATGIGRASVSAVKLIEQQRKILEQYRNYGRNSAFEMVGRLQAQRHLQTFRKDIVPLPCDETERASPQGAAPISQSTPLPIGRISVYATLGLLMLAAAIKMIEARDSTLKKRGKRYPCALACVIQLSTVIEQAQVVDLSRLGAKIRLSTACDPGAAMEIGVSGQQISARVVWHNSNYAGVVFRKRLSAAALKTVLSGSA